MVSHFNLQRVRKMTNKSRWEFKFYKHDINMINLSLDELRLVARNRNIRDYENKSEKEVGRNQKSFLRIKT